MAASFNELRNKVLLWSNRDDSILTPDLLTDFMTYAADKAYRGLRIPPFENTTTYVGSELSEADRAANRLPIPPDLTEFIHIRIVDAFGTGNSIVLNNKADTRTFHDYYGEKYDVNYTWTRQGQYVLLPSNPGIQDDCSYEIYYYGRLPGLNTRYDVSYENYEYGVVSITNTVSGDDVTIADEAAYDTAVADTDNTVVADEVFNWFVHENERILLFGALSEAFAYLGEDDMQVKYGQMYLAEIEELNKENEMRNASGGNVQVNFNGRGLI